MECKTGRFSGYKTRPVNTESSVWRKSPRHSTLAYICTLVRSLFYKFRIYEVKDGEEAIGKVFEIQPDPIILDLMMHHINGLKAARKLRQMKVKVPIILFTRHAGKIPPNEFPPKIVSAVVPKPNVSELHNRVETFLNE
jgi:CheY-like chemotaxis protein